MPDAWTAADAYEPFIGRWSRALAPTFVAWARLPKDGTVLDVGCGTGALSEAVALAGARAVAGLDTSAAYVAEAARRLPRGRFAVGDATDIRHPDGSFDAAVSGLVLNFVPDPGRMLTEMRRVVRPGGIVSVYVWDYAGRMEILRRFWDAAVALNPARAGPLDEGRRFPICDPRKLVEAFAAAGLAEVESGSVEVEAVFRDFDDYWLPFLGGNGPAPGYAATLAENERTELREKVRANLPFRKDGTVALQARAWSARGVR